ncbi:autotransporter adhesin BpaC-like isoform X1 [Coregonus clupeaformis]|uniref:autotransporter adhesin BpaC-like isoform X1 n=1 Tax=Coregonus clupeaformis TaxID=59861 RepID=UPI001E1C30DA|nr:autotransporter adhesin BpaC-like isoform X1 [Coregonus clupeaformis]
MLLESTTRYRRATIDLKQPALNGAAHAVTEDIVAQVQSRVIMLALWEKQARTRRSRASSSQLCGSNRPGYSGAGQLLSALWEQQARTRRSRAAPLSSVGATGQDTAEQGSSSQLYGRNRPGHGGAGPAPLSSVGATGQDTAEQASSSQLCGSNRPGHGGAGQLLSALWEQQARTRRSRASSSQLCGSNRPGYSGAGQLLSALWEQQARTRRSRAAPLSSVGATGQDTAEQASSSQLCGSNRPGHGGTGQLLSALWEQQARTRRSRAAPLSSVGATGQDTAEQISSSQLRAAPTTC